MKVQRTILLLVHGISLVFLGLGLIKDMLQLDVSAHFIVRMSLFSENKSILGALHSLWDSGNYFPFSLIFLFGIIVPLAKSIILSWILIAERREYLLYQWIGIISKWAMADVFAISIFTAFLGANAMQNTAATLQPGFYYFAGYALLSNVVATWLGNIIRKQV
ncbi:MAG: paraquat-inducible protein A [Chitinophagaceae bacterium]|nr:paraquat-inducible protein A [Chitinophagaceae bacterium]